MRIFIPTVGRATPEQQSTLAELRKWGVPATLLVDYGDYDKHAHLHDDIVELPPGVKGTGHIRDHIVRELSDGEYVCMLDDDLTFFVRRTDDPTKFREGTPEEFRSMLKAVEINLVRFPHVGVACREGGQRITDKFIYNTRILRLLAYDPKVLIKEDIWFSGQDLSERFYTIEDFHVALCLLRRGYPNLILNSWCHNQRGSNLTGGCSTYRTPEVQAAAARKLAELHPGLVKVVQKETKSAWGGGVRTDVVISWKKAFNAS